MKSSAIPAAFTLKSEGHGRQLATARKLVASQEILPWMTPWETPKALQASDCSELL